AMALLDSGLLPGRFSIDAADISARALVKAQRGLYGKNSFRGKEVVFRDRYFHPEKDGHALHKKVSGCVNFFQDNLLSDSFLSGHAAYDYVFCRNLLIYFDHATQLKALARIQQVLAPRGVLFVGPAELPIFLDQGFIAVDMPMSFACRKAA